MNPFDSRNRLRPPALADFMAHTKASWIDEQRARAAFPLFGISNGTICRNGKTLPRDHKKTAPSGAVFFVADALLDDWDYTTEGSVNSRASLGGTAASRVEAALNLVEQELGMEP